MIKIFNANETNFTSNGNIVINPLKCIETKKKSLNGWYIDVELPIKYANYIEQDKLCVVKTKSKVNPQAFRIKNINKTTRKITFQAQHVMFDAEGYFLVDVRPEGRDGQGVLDYVNNATDKTSPFTVYSNVSNTSTAYFIRKNLLEAWAVIEERWNGVFDADNWEISFLNSVGNDNGETISYQNNLQGIEIFEDWSNVCTKIYPVGFDGLLLPERYIEADIQYDEPYTRTIEFATDIEEENRTEASLLQELRNKANAYLLENKYPKVSYEIASNVKQSLDIGDIIHVKHPLVNILTETIEYQYDTNTGKVKNLKFGNYNRDVKAKFNSIKETVGMVSERLSEQDMAIQKQTELINTLNKTGYVYIDENEILILDTLPKENATNVWRWGLGGLGFSSNGYEGPFITAITMNGQINANFITTGSLSASIIKTGNLRSNNYISNSQGTSINLNDGSIDTRYFKVNSSGEITATGGNIGGFTLSSNKFSKSLYGLYDYSILDAEMTLPIIRGDVSLTSYLLNLLDATQDNNISISDASKIAAICRGSTMNNKYVSGNFAINSNDPKYCLKVTKDGEVVAGLGIGGITSKLNTTEYLLCGNLDDSNYKNYIIIDGIGQSIVLSKNSDASKLTITPDSIVINGSPVQTGTSDKKLKHNIKDSTINALEKINKIKHRQFDWNKDNTHEELGYIAQELEKVNENLVIKNKYKDGYMYSINMLNMISLSTKAIQEQQSQINDLKSEIEELKKVINSEKNN